MKQGKKSVDRVRELLAENQALRARLRAGEDRRRAAVGEISFLHRRLAEQEAREAGLLAVHRATLAVLTRTLGTPDGPGAWVLTYPPARAEDLDAYALEAGYAPGGAIRVRVAERGENHG